MDLEALRALIAVVDGGSLLVGADALGASRATVRRRLDELEATTGVALLHRGPRGVTPTAAGELMVRQGRVILAEADMLFDAVQGMSAEPRGTVRVCAPVGMPPRNMAMLIQGLRHRWPRLSVDLRFAERPLEGLLSGTELAITLERAAPEGPFEHIELPSIRESLLGARAYLDRHPPITTPADVLAHPLHVWRNPEHTTHSLPLADGSTLAIEPALTTTDIHLLRLLASSQAGLVFAPDPGINEPLPTPLVPVLPDLITSHRPVRVVVPRSLVELPKIRVILDTLRDFLRAVA